MTGDGYLTCVGLTTIDVVALPVQMEAFEGVRLLSAMQILPAGTAAGAALIAARLGVPTRLIGAVGADAMGRFVLGELAHAGVDVSLSTTADRETTSATLIAIDPSGSRTVYHAPGASPGMELTAPAHDAACASSVVHYAGIGAKQLDGGRGANLLAAASAKGALITCDLIAPGPKAAAEARRLLPHVDVFMPSAVEARFLTGEEDLEVAGATLRSWGARACVIKNGAEGALAFSTEGRLDRIAAIPLDSAADTTSCGDSFCAGFIAATLRGRHWLDALRFGAATASLVAQGPATLGKLESYEQVNRVLEQSEPA